MYPIINEVKYLINQTWNFTDWRGRTHCVNLANYGWKLKTHNKKRSLGTCSPKKRTIFLSKPFLEHNQNNTQLWTDVMLHEIAHALDVHIRNKSDHSKRWKMIAKQIGAHPRSCTKFNANSPKSKYTLKCKHCGYESVRHRKIKRSFSCNKCHPGVYNEKYKLELIQNY